MSDILSMLVRQDRVKKLLEKKEKEWTEEENSKKTGGPITFSHEYDKTFESFMEFMIEEDSDEEDEENDGETKKEFEKLPTLTEDFIFEPPTVEEIVKERIDEYSKIVYHMEKKKFIKLCIQEGVLDENQVFY